MMIKAYESIERIKKLRKAKGYSVKEMAKRAGLNKNKYWNIENHKSTLYAHEMVMICNALDVPAGILCDEVFNTLFTMEGSQIITIIDGLANMNEKEFEILQKIMDQYDESMTEDEKQELLMKAKKEIESL